MTTSPYSDADLRREAARQIHDRIQNADAPDVDLEMEDQLITPDRVATWGDLKRSDRAAFKDAHRQVDELIEDAVDVTEWSVRLGANYLRETTDLAWGRGGDCWDIAVQVAHRPGIGRELHDALVAAAREAVSLVLSNRGIDLPPATPAP